MITEINYKPNLSIVDNYVYSYKTKVAKIDTDNNTITKIPYSIKYNGRTITNSPTTTTHINKVANEFNLRITN